MENTIVGIIALGLIVYLIFTIIRPEKFYPYTTHE